MTKVTKTDEQWRETLTEDQYRVCRLKGTERAFSGAFCDTHTPGTYFCVGCEAPLFRNTEKFDSGSGWPSYWAPVSEESVVQNVDKSHGMHRVEVCCARCDSHLGHVFEDGPKPTGLRFCINSVALRFVSDATSREAQ